MRCKHHLCGHLAPIHVKFISDSILHIIYLIIYSIYNLPVYVHRIGSIKCSPSTSDWPRRLEVTKTLITAPGASKSIDPIDPFPTSYSCRAILAQQNQTSRTHWRSGATNLVMTRNITTRLMSFFDNQHIGEIAFCEKLIHWSFFEASFFDKNRFLISRIETHEASQQLLLLFNSQLCTNISSFQSATRATSVYAWHGVM